MTPSGDAMLRQSIARQPADGEAWRQLALFSNHAGRLAAANWAFARRLALSPYDVSATVNRGNLLRRLGHRTLGERLLRRALALAGSDSIAAESVGQALWEQGLTRDARRWYGRALACDPANARARLGRCISNLPVVYDEEADLETMRRAYDEDLGALERWTARAGYADIASLADAIGAIQPFFLAYQGRNDKDLQGRYGRLVDRALSVRHPEFCRGPMPAPQRPDGRLRIGLVSGYFRRHSAWKMALSGWIEGLDRKRFALYGYHTGQATDDVTRRAASLLDGFFIEDRRRAAIAERIVADRLDAVLYPEIGMDPVTAWLAALRLAPVQMMSWGHPVTSGYPTIDYFLSSDLMEPPCADDHYVERLERLPGLGCLYRRPDVVAGDISRAHLGLAPDDVVYLCAQSLFKYLPQHDWIFEHIASAVPRARFVFYAGTMPAVATRFRDRLARRLAAAGHDPQRRLIFLPVLTEAGFLGVGRLGDVLLDSIGWSGFNTTIEIVIAGVPVIALAGRTLRGRHTSAVLTRIGCADLIADDEHDYVRRAILLGLDRDAGRAEGKRIAAASSLLFDDPAPIRALETVLESACRR
jgi:predicted O-linked N-acetylglucosamine transferase (SPINDLY family)/Flp pilus assembly protein TadD